MFSDFYEQIDGFKNIVRKKTEQLKKLEKENSELLKALEAIKVQTTIHIFSDCNKQDKCFTLQSIRELADNALKGVENE